MVLSLLGEVPHTSCADDGTWLLAPKSGFAGLCFSTLVHAPPLLFWAGASEPLPGTETRRSLAGFCLSERQQLTPPVAIL